MTDMIEVNNLRKTYNKVEAIKGIDFTVAEGSFFALLGENGAGKTTTIRIIAALDRQTSGGVVVGGHRAGRDDTRIRRDIGVVFQGHMLDGHLTVRENVRHRGALYGLSRGETDRRLGVLAGQIGVAEFADRPYGRLSGGQKRRADIVRALINEPRLLILDEPTTGLDPHTRQSVWETVRRLKEERGLTVLLTTHYMEEAAGADHIVILDTGRVRAAGTPEQLRLRYSSDRLILIPRSMEALASAIREMRLAFTVDRDRMEIPLGDSRDAIPIMARVGDMVAGLEVVRGNMDDVFINIIREGGASPCV